MELLKSASKALQQHRANLALYIAVVGVLSLADSALALMLGAHIVSETPPTLADNVLRIGWFTGYSAIFALVQAVVFSRIGREIDRPLWKVRDDREALSRFFLMWFEFNLVLNTFYWISGTFFGKGEIQALNLLALFIAWTLSTLIVPFGSCIMFFGSFSWNTLGEALAPFARRTIELAPVFGVTVIQCAFGTYVIMATQSDGTSASVSPIMLTVARVIANLLVAYLDCLVFASVWLVCKDDRDSPDELDLDF